MFSDRPVYIIYLSGVRAQCPEYFHGAVFQFHLLFKKTVQDCRWLVGSRISNQLTVSPFARNLDCGADLSGQRPVCQTGEGGSGSRRGPDGDRDSQLHHKGGLAARRVQIGGCLRMSDPMLTVFCRRP